MDALAALRRHWRIPVASFVVAVLATAMFVLTRDEVAEPERFTTEATVQIPSDDPEAMTPPGELERVPRALLRGVLGLASAQTTKDDALERSGLPPRAAGVEFSERVSEFNDFITLYVTARDPDVSRQVAQNWVDAFIEARRVVAADAIAGGQDDILDELRAMRVRQAEVVQELFVTLGRLPTIGGQDTATTEDEPSTPRFEVPETDLDTTLLVFERVALRNRMNDLQFKYAALSVEAVTARPWVDVINKGLTRRIAGRSEASLAPAAAIFFVIVLLGFGAAVVSDLFDRSIRSARVAASVFSAPVLAAIPGRAHANGNGHTFTALGDDRSAASEAYRTLGATSLATDRLPRAIMVSTPEGTIHEEVAANFAAALAELNVRVALVATSERQAWYREGFTEPVEGPAMTLTELLEQAHAGRLNGEIPHRLAVTDLSPNLVLVGPGPDTTRPMPLDGLPSFLDAMAAGGIDVTVIAGPPLLEDSNATIVAWATRNVLWAVQVGKLTQEAARAAAARLELAGVTPFGVVLVGEEQ
jgi:Mrp family chromosome partitioning ATPase